MQGEKQWAEIVNTKLMQPENHDRTIILKFWEIDRIFTCPVVGICLTLAEQKQLLRKAGFDIKKKSPFEIHETLIASSDSESRLSRRLDHLLNRKFGKEAIALTDCNHKGFMKRFKTVFENGNLKSAIWAAAIKHDLPSESKREIFGIIHMSMHLSGEENIILKEKLNRHQQELIDMRQNIQDTARYRRLLQKENEILKRNYAKLNFRIDNAAREKNKLKETLAALDNRHRIVELEQENQRSNKALSKLLEGFDEKQHQEAELKEKNLRLLEELERQREANRCLREEIRKTVLEVCALNSCDASCPSFDLCQKRVLIVGGITRMEAQYRQVVESTGGVFEYHDGYMKKGVKRLESRLKRADVVLCPVSCNSHAACSSVKKLAKKHNKTVHMLANSSLSTVYQTILKSAGESVD